MIPRDHQDVRRALQQERERGGHGLDDPDLGGLGIFMATDLMPLILAHAGRLSRLGA